MPDTAHVKEGSMESRAQENQDDVFDVSDSGVALTPKDDSDALSDTDMDMLSSSDEMDNDNEGMSLPPPPDSSNTIADDASPPFYSQPLLDYLGSTQDPYGSHHAYVPVTWLDQDLSTSTGEEDEENDDVDQEMSNSGSGGVLLGSTTPAPGTTIASILNGPPHHDASETDDEGEHDGHWAVAGVNETVHLDGGSTQQHVVPPLPPHAGSTSTFLHSQNPGFILGAQSLPSLNAAGLIPLSPETHTPNLQALQDLMLNTVSSGTILESANDGLSHFLQRWAQGFALVGRPSERPDLPNAIHQTYAVVEKVRRSDLKGDEYDIQGLNWADMGLTRSSARRQRRFTYRNFVNRHGSDQWVEDVDPCQTPRQIPSTDNFVRFKETTIRPDVQLAHFQLRTLMASPSRSRIMYATRKGINCLNPLTGKTELALSLPRPHSDFDMERHVTTMDARHGVLVAGTWNGDYLIKSLESDDMRHTEGSITSSIAGITNHVQIHTRRHSPSPVAAISSNDHGFRLLDVQTQKILASTLYQFPVNSSSVSADGRLRALVGDYPNVIIANADTGESLVELSGHRDYGFASDWSPCGRFVATGFQDKTVKIWDARKWTNSNGEGSPLTTIWCELAGARSLRFSPEGSGPPVLVAAEEADMINVINASTFQSKQQLDIFGEIGGIGFSNEGEDLHVLCTDEHRGGIVSFNRCAYGATRIDPPLPYWDGESKGWQQPHCGFRGAENRRTKFQGPDVF